jgi:hypothetical protein
MHSMRPPLQKILVASSLALLLFVLWVLMRGYQGFAGDAQIYAFQALARIHLGLSTDLYLSNTSQDQYTVFSPFYAWFIRCIGLESAARLLTLFFTAWLIAAAWMVAVGTIESGGASDAEANGAAWLGAAFLVIAAGDYGAAGVFRISDSFLTARLPAEALVVTAMAFYCHGRRILGFALAIAALFVHPLMALPGILLLICLSLPVRLSLIGAIVGVFAALGAALAAVSLPAAAQVLTVMDADWLDVVRERSQFLFLQLWSLRDWDISLRPLIYLTFIATAIKEAPIRRVCLAGLIVGGCGFAVALIGCLIGPIAVLVQGQAWRWEWIACFLSVLLLPATLLRIWRDEPCGRLCAVLLLGGWVVSALGGTGCVLLALILWTQRMRVGARTVEYFRWMALLGAFVLLAWIISASVGHGSVALNRIGGILAAQVAAAALFALLWWWLRGAVRPRAPLIVSAALLVASIFIVPASFTQARTLGSDAKEFSDWSDAIPADSTVFVAPARDVGSFVWFTLRRPNYLALDQSAGVVFSRATALEIRRRSEVLLPLTQPTWKILSGIRRHAAKLKEDAPPTRPLTAASLIEVCGDPKLGFVISPEHVGFAALRHTREGAWKDWNLYDCRQTRQKP